MHITMSLPAYGVNMAARLEIGKGPGVEACEIATGESVVLCESEKVLSENGPKKVVWPIAKPGVVVIRLDNTHSMLRHKTFNYLADYKVPDDGSLAASLGVDGEVVMNDEAETRGSQVAYV